MKRLKTLACVVLFMFATTLLSCSAFASTKLVQLKEKDKTYSSYDFNGDGKADKFKVSFNGTENGYINIYLNGKKNTIFIARGCLLYYYKYSKKNEFLLVERSLYGGHEILVYKFSGNKIKEVQELKTSCFSAPNIGSAKGKKLTIKLSPYHMNQIKCLKNYTLPNYECVSFNKIYKIDTSAHKFKSSSNYIKPVKNYPLYYYGSGTYATSSDSLKDNGKGVKLEYGKKYTLKQARIVPYTQNGYDMDYARFQVADSNGNTGWFDSREELNFYYSKQ